VPKPLSPQELALIYAHEFVMLVAGTHYSRDGDHSQMKVHSAPLKGDQDHLHYGAFLITVAIILLEEALELKTMPEKEKVRKALDVLEAST
jgi:hypothetical protein